MSKHRVNAVEPASGNSLTIGAGATVVGVAGTMEVQVADGTVHRIIRTLSAGEAEGTPVLHVTGNGGGGIVVAGANTHGYSPAAAVLKVSTVFLNGRSVSTGGTVNTGGTDYAEYELKADGCGPIAKGDLVGFDAEGRVTDRWSQARSFGVKSTAPSFVGGDNWARAIGPEPAPPVREEGTSDAAWLAVQSAYASALADWQAQYEAARARVDRVAYSGKVPVNGVGGCEPGDYVLAAQGPGDTIVPVRVASEALTFTQYRHAIGRVRRLLDDGRPEVAVIIH